MKICCALVGYGYWGHLLAAKLESSPHFSLRSICDLKFNRKSSRSLRSSEVDSHPQRTASLEHILHDHDIQAVFVAVPPHSHYEVTLAALKANKHVWLEKPCCENEDELAELIDLARRRELTLQLDFIMLFNPLIQEMKSLTGTVINGPQLIFRAVRHNLTRSNQGLSLDPYFESNSVQKDLGLEAVKDLGIHDLSVLKYLLPELCMSHLEISLKPYFVGDHSKTQYWLLTLNSTTLNAELNLSQSCDLRRRSIEWGVEEDRFLCRSEKDQGEVAERLYRIHEGTSLLLMEAPKGGIDPLDRALGTFYQSINMRRSLVDLWKIGLWCHKVIHASSSLNHQSF